MKNIKNKQNKNGDRIEVKIRNVDSKVWNLAKRFLESSEGTYYGHMGEFVSQALRFYFEHHLGISVDNPTLKHGEVKRKLHKVVHKRKKYIIIKICEELLNFDEDFWMSARTVRSIISEKIEDITGYPPSRPTIKDYFDYLKDNGGLVRNVYTNEFGVCHEKLKKIIDRLNVS